MSDTFDHEQEAYDCQRESDDTGFVHRAASGVYRSHEFEMLDFKFTVKLSESDNAWFLKFKDGNAYWFPKSRCVITHGKDQANISIPRWLAQRKGFAC